MTDTQMTPEEGFIRGVLYAQKDLPPGMQLHMPTIEAAARQWATAQGLFRPSSALQEDNPVGPCAKCGGQVACWCKQPATEEAMPEPPIGTHLQSIVDWYGAQAAGGIIIESLAHRISRAVTEHQAIQRENTRLVEALAEKADDVEGAQRQLRALNGYYETRTAECRSLHVRIGELEQSLAQSRSETTEWKQKYQNLDDHIKGCMA